MTSSMSPRKMALCIGAWVMGVFLAAVSLVKNYHVSLNRALILSLVAVVVGITITLLCKRWFDKA